MRSRARAADAEREVVRACYRGLDVAGVQYQVLAALRRVMSVDAAFFATADPDTLLFTSAYAEAPLRESGGLFLDNEFGAADVNKFATLATSRRHVASLDTATRDKRSASPRYREVMGPIGLGDELRAALVVDAGCWGYLCLHREDGRLGFAASDRALLARLGPHIAYALRQAMLLHPPSAARTAPGPGVVLLADDLSVLGATPQAAELLALLEDDGPPRRPLPVPVHTVAAALRALERAATAAPCRPSTRVRTMDGRWLEVHASRLQGPAGDGPIAVVLERADRHQTASLLLAAHGLSPREAEVARLVLRGTPTTAIADALHISRHTVQDHLKAVFDKVGVRSRRDLVGHLLGSPASTG
jgi:DNA-binding CsgD family transcriptional regulator